MRVTTLLAFAALSTPAFSQTLNQWRHWVHPICCYEFEPIIDGDPSTSAALDISTNEITILTGTREELLGFYMQTSGRWIHEAQVTIYDPFYNSPVVGRGVASPDKPGWMVIPFYYPDGEPGAIASYFNIEDTAWQGNWTGIGDTKINEIWPIYPGDEIAFPEGYTPPAWNPVKTIAPIPKAEGLRLERWPEYPTYLAGAENPTAIHDRNIDTSVTLHFPASLKLSFFSPKNLKGLYVLSNLQNYHVISEDAYTREDKEICRVTNASGDFTVCPFKGDHGGEFFYSNDFTIVADGVDNATVVTVNEVWPIFAGDDYIDPEVVDVYAS